MKKQMSAKRYFTLQGEADFICWQLEKMYAEGKKPKAPIEMIIDESTGFNKEQIKYAKMLMKRFKTLKKILGYESPSMDSGEEG